jgi:molybdopterin-guanine dinucleotide biosynthesis protein B
VRIVTVVGSKKGGKTTVVCELVEQLKAAGYKVATIKLLERVGGIDVSDRETDLHRKAGADLTIASGLRETAILKKVKQREDLRGLLSHVPSDFDFVVCEGVVDPSLHNIVVGREAADVDAYVTKMTVAVSGIVAGKGMRHRLPVIDVTKNAAELAAIVKAL